MTEVRAVETIALFDVLTRLWTGRPVFVDWYVIDGTDLLAFRMTTMKEG